MQAVIVTRSEPAGRPESAQSIQETARQRLQHPTARHVHTIDKDPRPSESARAAQRSDVWGIAPSPTRSTGVTIQNPTSQNGNKIEDFSNGTLKHIVFEKVNSNLVEVLIRCVFLRVGEIDTLNERYYAEILFEASWEEKALKGFPMRSFDPAVHWTPELELMNGIGELQDRIAYHVHYDKQGTATVTEHHRLKGILWERMELQHFPVDVQDLSLVITTSRTNREMKFFRNLRKPSGVNRRVFTDEQEWYLFEHVDIAVNEQVDEYVDDEHNHSVVVCSCHAARKYGYFIWNAYFLIFLITSASFTTFPIPLGNIFGRAQIGCTLLLTSITFRWLCNKALPTISYLTAVDIYAIGSIFSLCLLNIYHGVAGYVNYYVENNRGNLTSDTGNDPNLIIIDRWALVAYTILFFAYQIGTVIWMYVVPWSKRRTMFKKDRENRLHLLPRSIETPGPFTDTVVGAKKTKAELHDTTVVSNIDF